MEVLDKIEKDENVHSDELSKRLMEISIKENQGDPFCLKDYVVLYIAGLFVPLTLMIIGWFL